MTADEAAKDLFDTSIKVNRSLGPGQPPACRSEPPS